MRRELVVPSEGSSVRIERQHRVAVKIVASAFRPVVVGAGIAGGPVQEPRFGIVRASQPRRGAAVLDGTSAPRVGPWLARRPDSPEPPNPFARPPPALTPESSN